MGGGIGEGGSEGHLSITGITSFLVEKGMLAAHSHLTEDWLEEGQQITEKECSCSSADRLAIRADKRKCPTAKAAVWQKS